MSKAAPAFDIGMAEHYDSLSVPSKARRSAGPAADMKRVHNDLKRAILTEHASNASFLVDVGCGRGGDLQKWVAAGVKNVVGFDVSEAQIEEAERRRATLGPAAAGYAFEVTGPGLEGLDDLPDGCADVASCMFALNYFFETEESAARMFRAVARILRPGGKFVGVCADGREVATLLRSPETFDAFELESLGPSATSLGDGFGAGYVIRVKDTVLDGEGGNVPIEFAVYNADLAKLARDVGLDPIAGAWRKPAFERIKDPGYRKVSQIYTSFAFVKSLVEEEADFASF